MNRIEVSSAYTGPANYTLPVNPYTFDAVDSEDITAVEVLHGAASHQKAYFDDRPRILIWPAYEMSQTSISSVVTYFRSIKGKTRYFNFKDIASMNLNWPTTAVSTANSDWKYGRVLNLSIKHRSGGKLRYDTIELSVQPEAP